MTIIAKPTKKRCAKESAVDLADLKVTRPKKTILIVEDQDDIRQLIKISLTSFKHEIYEANDCQTALNMARTLKPDLMLLDVMLPAGVGPEAQQLTSGLSLCDMLKSDPELASMPIILLTSKGQTIDIKAGFAAGANEYIVKPFSVTHLIDSVQRNLSTSHQLAV